MPTALWEIIVADFYNRVRAYRHFNCLTQRSKVELSD